MSTKISTGRVSDSFEVIDTIFAIDSHKEGFWSGSADPNKAFDGVKQVLRKKCEQLGEMPFRIVNSNIGLPLQMVFSQKSR